MTKQNFTTEECIDYTLGKTVQSVKNLLFREFKANGHNITPEQWAVMSYLCKEDGLYQKQIADFLFKDKPTVTRILDLLEKRNLIIRMSDEKDRRKFKIYLTQDGKNTVKQLIPIANDVQEKIRNNMPLQEIEVLIKLLDKIYANSIS
jgi:DNA-binding MarR family transcriptional regulator